MQALRMQQLRITAVQLQVACRGANDQVRFLLLSLNTDYPEITICGFAGGGMSHGKNYKLADMLAKDKLAGCSTWKHWALQSTPIVWL